MSKQWPNVRLGELLRLDLDRVPVDSATSYPMVGVLSFGQGLFEREPVENGNTSYRHFLRIKAKHIVMSQLFGWEGALALSSEKFEGRYLSPQFPTFLCDVTKVDRSFLGWALRRPILWENLGTRTTGMGDRRRTLNPEALLACEIPLPPLAEQQRVVKRMEELSAKINEASILRQQAMEEAEAFITSVHSQLAGKRTLLIGDILKLDEDVVPIVPTGSYPQVGIRSFGAGLFSKAAVSGMDTTYRAFNRLYEGALILSQVKGWEGAVAVCPADLEGWFVSPEYRTFRCIPSEARPGYLAPLIRTKWFWGKLANATRGVGARRERTRPEQFLSIQLPMPDVEHQRQGEEIFAEVNMLKRLQGETSNELSALMPAILDRAFKGEL